MSSYSYSHNHNRQGYNPRRYSVYQVASVEAQVRQYRKKAEVLLAIFWVILCVGVGGGLAWLLKPWLDSLGPILDRQFGATPQVYRDISRASGLAAYGLLWLSMAFGILISGKISRLWPGALEAFELHRFCSLLALGATLLHILILIGDPRLGSDPVPLLAFGMLAAKAPWAWLGQLSLYAMAIVVGSFYVRKWIGKQAWRLIHAATFALYLTALAHSVGATTDSSIPTLAAFYWATVGGLGVLSIARIVATLRAKRKKKRKVISAHAPAPARA